MTLNKLSRPNSDWKTIVVKDWDKINRMAR